MNRVFFYPLRFSLPLLFAMVMPLHGEDTEVLSDVDVAGILAAQSAADTTVFSQKALLRASNKEAGDYFQAVAISGDTLVVGAPFEDGNAKGVNGNDKKNNMIHAGAAYVYVRTGNQWIQQAYLKASNPGKNDQFGFSVAISGSTIVIGAFGEDSKSSTTQGDNSAADAGAAYVFTRTGITWTQQAYLKSSTAAAGNLFGYSVAIAGNSLVVGAMGESAAASGTDTTAATERAGAAYVFTRTITSTASTWTQQASLKASNAGAGDLFGVSVGISGDTVVVGAQNESSDSTGVNGAENDDTLSNSGAAYVFVRADSKWTKQAYLKASNTGKGDLFGHAVAISGTTIVVGAHQESSKARGVNKNQSDNSAAKSGAAYVFTRNVGKKWKQQAYLKASNTGTGDGFGRSVAISGDSVLIGAYGEDSNARGVKGNQLNNSLVDSGAAYIYGRSSKKWSQKYYLKSSNAGKNHRFGMSAAIDANISVVSAPGVGKNEGAAYLFESDLSPRPEIVIEKTTDGVVTNLLNGSATVDFGTFKLGDSTVAQRTQTFRIRNTGTTDLTGLSFSKSGTNSANYTLVNTNTTTVLPGGSTTFTILLEPGVLDSSKLVAAITVKSNDLDEAEFKIALTGQVLSTTADKDGDGLKDYAEYQYAGLGFNWETPNVSLVKTLNDGAKSAGLFTADELKDAVKVTTPVLTKDTATGMFTLSLAVEKSTDLKTFAAFPLTLQGTTAATTTFTDGKLQFKFTSPDKAAFYRVLAK